MAEHTAAPRNRWFLSSSNDAIYEMCADGANRLICFVEPQGSLTRANAAFIVQAVNSHESLIANLVALLEGIEEYRDTKAWPADFHVRYVSARAALALAKGESQ